ncbi:MAG: hypothetical protein WCL14_12020 [Bacteroidota bacterium]
MNKIGALIYMVWVAFVFKIIFNEQVLSVIGFDVMIVGEWRVVLRLLLVTLKKIFARYLVV